MMYFLKIHKGVDNSRNGSIINDRVFVIVIEYLNVAIRKTDFDWFILTNDICCYNYYEISALKLNFGQYNDASRLKGR